MQDLFIDISDNLLTDIRLLVEGALSIYEKDMAPLSRLASENDLIAAYRGFNTVASALYDLRDYICEFEDAHTKESQASMPSRRSSILAFPRQPAKARPLSRWLPLRASKGGDLRRQKSFVRHSSPAYRKS